MAGSFNPLGSEVADPWHQRINDVALGVADLRRGLRGQRRRCRIGHVPGQCQMYAPVAGLHQVNHSPAELLALGLALLLVRLRRRRRHLGMAPRVADYGDSNRTTAGQAPPPPVD